MEDKEWRMEDGRTTRLFTARGWYPNQNSIGCIMRLPRRRVAPPRNDRSEEEIATLKLHSALSAKSASSQARRNQYVSFRLSLK